MVKLEYISIPSANMGKPSPLPDIKNISYIGANQECTDAVSEEDRKYIGKGKIPTLIPYKIQDDYDRSRDLKDMRVVVLENDKIRVEFMPDYGARLRSIYDKENQRELLYKNPVFQPGNLALLNAWFSGGIEFNAGIKGHTPLTCSKVWCSVDETDDGLVVRFYEFERVRKIVYSVSAWLPENSSVLYLRCRMENFNDKEIYSYWWSNIAFPETKGTRVIVPTDESFVCEYRENRYLLDKCAVPLMNGKDITYPDNIDISRDFFYKIPPQTNKWIAATGPDGYSLIQCSDDFLKGRKLFVWGQGQGGRNWNEWLSVEGSAYIEIQAGLAHTQLEHIPMSANTTWEWTEAYFPYMGDASKLHGDYKTAVDTIQNEIISRVGDPNKMQFPDDSSVKETKILCEGSSWGFIEEELRGKKISATLKFENTNSPETNIWIDLLKNKYFYEPESIEEEPLSFVSDARWLPLLENAEKQTWYTKLHIGIINYALGDVEKAHDAWNESLNLRENPWAYRNMAMLYKSEYKDFDKAISYILRAFELKKDCCPLCAEVASLLTANGKDDKWLEIYENLSAELKTVARIRFFKALALTHIGKLELASEIINPDFVMSDVREGELSVSHLWFEIYRGLYAKEHGCVYDKNDIELIRKADEKYPLPKKLDFRMH